MKSLLALFIISSTAISQETFIVRGTIRDAETGESVPSANIREIGTSRGTVANADGRYLLHLWPGKRRIVASCLGYKPDTLQLMLTGDEAGDFSLTPSEIVLPEILVSGEDPAIEIIRRAIANKKKWMERLNSFEMDAFTRQVLKRDGKIASITESFTNGYWQRGDTLREIVKQKRQTENVKSEFNFASVGRIINFNDDEIRFIGYTFVGPTADDALDYYDYKLLRTQVSHGKEIFEIRMIPRTRTRPLFNGTVSIAGDSYALMGIDVEPNEAFSIPFVKAKSLRYRQQFGLYDHSFWMPVDIRIDAGAEISIPLILIPTIDFSQTSVISNYEINTAIPDTIFRKPRLTVDTIAATIVDTLFWAENNVLPLTLEEEKAYATLDSTQTLEVQFRPRGITFQLGAGEGGATSALQFLDFSFNRVEGFHLGSKIELDSISTLLQLRGGLAYGFSDRRGKYNVGATVFTSPKRNFGFGFDVYRKIGHRPDQGYYGALFNTLTSLIAKNDYRDYFEAEGWQISLTYAPTKSLESKLSFAREEHQSVQQNSNYSFFSRSRSYRENPHIQNGKFSTVQWKLRLGEEPAPLDLIRRNALEFHIENMAGAWGTANRVWATGTLVIPTFSKSMLFPQLLSMRLSGGTSDKNVYPQQLFDLESASTGYAPFGVFRAMNVKEFSGTHFAAMNLEHNFRSVPFLALGIPFLYENNIEFIIHGGAARTWAESRLYVFLYPGGQLGNISYTVPGTSGWCGELGFGFSRIFELLRADFTWRLSTPRNFRFTLAVANLF